MKFTSETYQCFVLQFLIAKLPTNQMLEGKDGVLWVCNSPSLSRKVNKTLSVLGEDDNRDVVRAPSEFSKTWEVLALHTETQELVVPRSIRTTRHAQCEICVQEK
jgi:hypothetical protein